jgi:C4-dicarboxylate-specific signal transduction histidine kinase
MTKILLAVLIPVLVALLAVLAWGLRRIRSRQAAAVERLKEQRRNLLAGLKIAEVEYVIQQIDRELDEMRAADDDVNRVLAARMWDVKKVLGRIVENKTAPFSVKQACSRAVESFTTTAGPRRVDLQMNDVTDAIVVGDPELFEWAIGELLVNVERHGGEWSRVVVSIDGSGDTVRLRFEDDGGGPDIAAASRLYGPFTPRKGSDGPGLGLFAVHRIVRRLGGTMDPGVSSTGGLFHDIEIPAAQP